MKIDLNYKIRNLEGEFIKDQVADLDEAGNPKRDKEGFPLLKTGKPITLRAVCIRALLNPPARQDPQTGRMMPIQMPAEEKIKRYNLAVEIQKAKNPMELSIDEIKLLKDLIGEKYPPLTVGQAWEILDPHTEN